MFGDVHEAAVGHIFWSVKAVMPIAEISKRHLNRKLRALGLFRRKNHTDIVDVATFIEGELQTSGQLHGYRWMHLRCIQNSISIDRETVRLLLGILDPEGVQQRARRRLQRRRYHVSGPNFLWHLDSYDKLKPYGICINGCIYVFSRNVLWVEAYITSSDPSVIAGYYMKTVRAKMGCPRVIRSDFGTENGTFDKCNTSWELIAKMRLQETGVFFKVPVKAISASNVGGVYFGNIALSIGLIYLKNLKMMVISVAIFWIHL